jgi:hypothetical protein
MKDGRKDHLRAQVSDTLNLSRTYYKHSEFPIATI